MRVATIVGARPQFVKAAPLSKVLREAGHHEFLIHTGQHYDYGMSKVFFEELSIPEPNVDLGVGSGPHGRQTGQMLIRIEEVLLAEKPDWVLVYGDTNSTLAGALAAVKLQLKLVHVEAGLRDFDMRVPEEVNRVLTDHVSTLRLCPTATAVANLRCEGITTGVYNVGDVMYDVMLGVIAKLESQHEKQLLKQFGVKPGSYVLLTVHRAENTDAPGNLQEIISAINEVGEPVVFPAHPRTAKVMGELGVDLGCHVRLLGPVAYKQMIVLEKNARMILTDSGGVQKEAYLLGVPCVTLRRVTGWTETVEAGWNMLVGADRDRILKAVSRFSPVGERLLVFGDGMASSRIVQLLEDTGR